MEPKAKLQHYVPQFYLANFAIKPERNKVHCFDKSQSKSFVVNINNVASETYFYDEEGNSKQTIETAFSVLEASFKLAYDKLISSVDLSTLTEPEREVIAFFVATQELRTREQRELIAEMSKEAKTRLGKENLTEELKKKIKIDEWGSAEQIKALHLDGLKRAPLYGDYILKMKWILLVNQTGIPFWTSDHPINRYNSIATKPNGNLGLVSAGMEIHYPLNPEIGLSFLDPIFYQMLPSKNEKDDPQNVIFHNWMQISHSTRYIFSNIDDFALAQKILTENPELKELT